MAPALVFYMGWIGFVEYEFRKDVRNVLVVLFLERFAPLSTHDLGSITSLLWFDGVNLDREALALFQNFETLCREIDSGVITAFNAEHPSVVEFDPTLKHYGKGPLNQHVRDAASGYLQFLDDHPDYWPPTFDEEGEVVGPPYDQLCSYLTPCFSTAPGWDQPWRDRRLSKRIESPKGRRTLARELTKAMTDPDFNWEWLVSGLGDELEARLTSMEATREWLRSEIIEPYGFDVPRDDP